MIFSLINNTSERFCCTNSPFLKNCIFCLVSIFGNLSGSAQHKMIRQQYDQPGPKMLYEKMFVHTDKTVYLAGELMWFKIYQVDGYVHEPLDVSKISYIEIISADRKPVLQGKIAMVSGTGSGSFLIPPSLNSGTYVLRAYTNWMKNFPSREYFEKQITIINSLKRPSWKPVSDSLYDFQLFPEGGDLVEGITSKVAFRITDQYGKGINCNGVVLSQDNDTVAVISTARFGIGTFSFSPQPGVKYHASVTVNNHRVVARLPDARKNGYVMLVHATERDEVVVTVTANGNTSNQVVSLLLHKRQVVKVAFTKSIHNGTATFNIDKKECFDGISYFTLFDAAGTPLCERLYFKRPDRKLLVEAKPGKNSYGIKEQVNVDVSSLRKPGIPLPADMSVSVFLVDSLQHPEQGDIFTSLWLASELKGTVESPSYYLGDTSKEGDVAIDNLMLTHGWRRFTWNDTLITKAPSVKFLPEYEGHMVEGRVIHKTSGEPGKKMTGFLSVPGKQFAFSNAVSDDEGDIRFVIKDFFGTEELIVQTDFRKDSMYRIDALNPFSEDTLSVPVTPFEVSENHKNSLVMRSIGVQSQNVFYPDSIRRFLLPQHADTTSFYGSPDKQYSLDDYTRFVTMEEVLREFVAEVRLRKQKDSFHFQVLNAPYKLFFEEDPMVLVDGVPFFDINKIVSLDPLKIEKIDIVTQRYYHGSMVNHGIVSYKTYEGDLGGFQLNPNALVVEYEGLQLRREFYSPVYGSENKTQNRLPDFRNVLYWSPGLITNGNGKGQFSFYTSEIPGTYAVVVCGITQDGFSGSAVTTFSVARWLSVLFVFFARFPLCSL